MRHIRRISIHPAYLVSIVYDWIGTHNHICSLQREGVSQIKKKEGSGIKRVNINIPTELHNSFKASTANQGLEMTVVLLAFIEGYVAKHGSFTPQKKGRRA